MSEHLDQQTQIAQILNRGVAQILPKKESLAQLMTERKIRLYLGIDPTGALLHLGHAVVLRKLQQFAELGHEVILLVGDGTVKIGDPTGRDSSRPVLSLEEINDNFKHWQEQASKILDFNKIQVRHNADWLDKLNYVDLVKLLAKTTVQQLIERDMFQDRLNRNLPIHGHEIIYPMLQGYDSVVMDVDLEIGGTDQTFNMMMGRTLQKAYHNKEKWVLTTPIINGLDGRKMSKSFNNYVALTEEPNNMYAQLMSMTDETIIEYFTLLTDLPLDEINSMKQAMVAGTNPMKFKKDLAFTITQKFHSLAAAQAAAQHFEKTVQKGEITDTVNFEYDSIQDDIINILKKAPTKRSRSDLRRLLTQNGITVIFNDGQETKADEQTLYKLAEIKMIKVGKRDAFKPLLKLSNKN